MHNIINYTIWEWLIFFYIYSFIGWIWESGYASVGKKRFVNRGFLHGPIIPIYGFGALGVLLCTLGVRDNIALVFLFGMIGATVLEYITGWGMEKLFRVKYWDYSNFKYNLNGYICLPASIGWGFFSVLLVDVINVPIQDFVLQIKSSVTELAALVLTAATAVDVHSSVGEALSLKEMLEKLSESKEYIRKLQRRMEVVSAVGLDEYRSFREKESARLASRKERFEAKLGKLRELKRRQLAELLSRAEEMKNDPAVRMEEVSRLLEGVYKQIQEMGARRDKDYKRIANLLRRNPSAASKKFAEVFEDIKDLTE